MGFCIALCDRATALEGRKESGGAMIWYCKITHALGNPAAFWLFLFPFLHTKEQNLNAFYRLGFRSVLFLVSPENKNQSPGFRIHSFPVEWGDEKFSHTEDHSVLRSGMVFVWVEQTLFPPHHQCPRPKAHHLREKGLFSLVCLLVCFKQKSVFLQTRLHNHR